MLTPPPLFGTSDTIASGRLILVEERKVYIRYGVACWIALMSCATPPLAPTCAKLSAAFETEKQALNTCSNDVDCSEIGPLHCPQGYTYIHREQNPSQLLQLDKAIEAQCDLPDCERAEPIGIAQCIDGHCVKGRTKPQETPLMSCWDTRYTWLENGGRVSARTQPGIQGITPLLAMGLPSDGTLTIQVDWAPGCEDCELMVSEHNSGMARLVQGERTRDARSERITLPATKGLYFFLGKAGIHPPSPFLLNATFQDASGTTPATTHHGVNWVRLCEG